MANKRNDWKNLLRIANEDLKLYGYALDVNDEEEEGFFYCNILYNGVYLNTYAGGFYEDELSDLINEAWSYVKSEMC